MSIPKYTVVVPWITGKTIRLLQTSMTESFRKKVSLQINTVFQYQILTDKSGSSLHVEEARFLVSFVSSYSP